MSTKPPTRIQNDLGGLPWPWGIPNQNLVGVFHGKSQAKIWDDDSKGSPSWRNGHLHINRSHGDISMVNISMEYTMWSDMWIMMDHGTSGVMFGMISLGLKSCHHEIHPMRHWRPAQHHPKNRGCRAPVTTSWVINTKRGKHGNNKAVKSRCKQQETLDVTTKTITA